MGTNRPTDRRIEINQYDVIELNRIVSMKEAVRLSNVSEDGWHRYHADKIVRLTPRRIGVRLRDALMLSG
jgi:hypothetical protein